MEREDLQEQQGTLAPEQEAAPQQEVTVAPKVPPALTVVASLPSSASMPIVEEAGQRLAAHGVTEISVATYIDLCKTQGDRNEVIRVLTNYGYPKDEVNSIFKNWTSKDRALKWWGLTKVSGKWSRKYYPLLALKLCRIKWGEPRQTASRHAQVSLQGIAGGHSR